MDIYKEPVWLDRLSPPLRRFCHFVYRFCWGTLGEMLVILVCAVLLTMLFTHFFIL